jgi:DNA-binding GntR family transcriptional regulator
MVVEVTAQVLPAPATSPERTGASARAADAVRAGILDGTYLPGARLSEPAICAAVDVSRNTLREAFRTLDQERLVVHELNRGVFVRVPTAADVTELYDCRRLVECAALASGGVGPDATAHVDAVARALTRARTCAGAGDWVGVGAADVDFHRAVVALAGSSRVAAMMDGVWNEVRLVFHVVGSPEEFHRVYVDRNHAIYGALAAGDPAAASQMLHAYLDDAEEHVLGVYRERGVGQG